MKLSPHFDSDEFRCPCCGKSCMMPSIVAALESLRAECGNRPVFINSGFRCEKHNKAVGGAPNSKHLFGLASDVRIGGLSGQEIYEFARTIPAIHGFGVAAGWIHIDTRVGPVVRWRYSNNGQVIAWQENCQ
ncbi:MAG: D-Ala-D-Ala carboxypeptidase family metallohydrolase [Paludibaculum sp.]